MYFSFLPFRPSHQLARSRSDSVSEAKGLLRIILPLQQRGWPGRPRYWRVRMMRSWTVPLSSWRWASAACCMGMDVCARRRSRPSASRAIVSSRAPGARSVVAWESVTPKSAAAGSDKVMTRLGPPARAIASARTPLPAASNTASTAPSARTRAARPGPYRTGVAPSSRASVSSCSPTALITLIPRATASCVAMMPEDTDGRLGRAGQRGGIDPRDGVWLAGPDRRRRVLGVPAQAHQQGRDAVPEGRAGDTGPNRVDGACRLEAEHGVRGQRDGLEIAGPQGEIGRADAGGLDLDPDLSLTRFPLRDPGPLQHLRRSVSSHHNRVGHSSSFLSGRGLGMAANGNFSVFVVRPLLLHRSRLATGPALPGPARGPDRQSLLAES